MEVEVRQGCHIKYIKKPTWSSEVIFDVEVESENRQNHKETYSLTQSIITINKVKMVRVWTGFRKKTNHETTTEKKSRQILRQLTKIVG